MATGATAALLSGGLFEQNLRSGLRSPFEQQLLPLASDMMVSPGHVPWLYSFGEKWYVTQMKILRGNDVHWFLPTMAP